MDLATIALLNTAVMVVVDRIRAVVPQVKGAWTNLLALVVSAAVAVAGDLGELGAALLPAIEDDTSLVAELVAGVAIAAGSALIDQIRQIGAGTADTGAVDGQQ